MNKLLCPICKAELQENGRALACSGNHCFDIAKEGYVNLLLGSKQGSLIGDNRDMAKSRKSFLDKGYFEPLAQELNEILAAEKPWTVLDICCGEGYYTAYIASHLKAQVYGFDISKEMIRLAAKRKSTAAFFVANMADIPLADAAVDAAIHLFAPFCEKEFARVIKPNGCLISVCPAKRHLFSLKERLYASPYENEEIAPELEGFTLESVQTVRAEFTLTSAEDIDALFRMTPYYYHTSPQDKQKLARLNSLETAAEFLIRIYRRN